MAWGASAPPAPEATRSSRIAMTTLARAVTLASWGGAHDADPGLRSGGEELGNSDRVGLVEVRSRLVGDDQRSVGHRRAGERDAPALASGALTQHKRV
jgi:hypothetical protein